MAAKAPQRCFRSRTTIPPPCKRTASAFDPLQTLVPNARRRYAVEIVEEDQERIVRNVIEKHFFQHSNAGGKRVRDIQKICCRVIVKDGLQAIKPCVEVRRRLCFKVRHVLLERVVLRVALQFQRIHIRNKRVVLRRRKGLIFSEPRLKLCIKSRCVDLLNDGGDNAAKRRVQALIRDLALCDSCYARAHVDVRQRKLVNVRVPLQCGL